MILHTGIERAERLVDTSPSTEKMNEALRLLEEFEISGASLPKDAEKLIANIFRACGLIVTETGFVGSDEGVDCYFRTNLGGKPQVIGVEVRANKKPVPTDVVERAFNLKAAGHFDRVMVVASGGFMPRNAQFRFILETVRYWRSTIRAQR